jgi:hypothetical protein
MFIAALRNAALQNNKRLYVREILITVLFRSFRLVHSYIKIIKIKSSDIYNVT